MVFVLRILNKITYIFTNSFSVDTYIVGLQYI